MSLFDENISFDEPVTREWLLSKGFKEMLDPGYKGTGLIVYIYVWKWRVEVTLFRNKVTHLVKNDAFGKVIHTHKGTTHTIDNRMT